MTRSTIGVAAAARTALAGGSPAARMGRDWVPVLQDVPLFQGLSRRHLRRVASLARPRRFPAGAPIVRTGDAGNAFYVVLDGSVRVTPPRGPAVTLRAGDSFGEMALLDGAPRSADVTALEETLTMSIGQSAFAKLLRSEPQLSCSLLRTVAQRLRAVQAST